MSVVVLFTTMSFTVNEHYCGDHLVDLSFFKPAESCGMEMDTSAPADDCSIEKTDCCTDVSFVVEGQNELKNAKIDFQKKEIQYTTIFLDIAIEQFEGAFKKTVPYQHFKPPLISRDIQKLYEVYRI